ncbi:MAG: hypothetical protein U1E70_14365 [Acetobacteraceae bacterium]
MAPSPNNRLALLAARTGAEVVVKHENHLPTGAFKVRGVELAQRPGNRVSRLDLRHPRQSRPVAGLAGARAGVPVTIVVPYGNRAAKRANLAWPAARRDAAGMASIDEHGDDATACSAQVRRPRVRAVRTLPAP